MSQVAEEVAPSAVRVFWRAAAAAAAVTAVQSEGGSAGRALQRNGGGRRAGAGSGCRARLAGAAGDGGHPIGLAGAWRQPHAGGGGGGGRQPLQSLPADVVVLLPIFVLAEGAAVASGVAAAAGLARFAPAVPAALRGWKDRGQSWVVQPCPGPCPLVTDQRCIPILVCAHHPGPRAPIPDHASHPILRISILDVAQYPASRIPTLDHATPS